MLTPMQNIVGISPLLIPPPGTMIFWHISCWDSFSNLGFWMMCIWSYVNHSWIFIVIFLYAVSSTRQTQAHLKYSRPDIVAMRRLPYNIKIGQLQTSAFQSTSPRLKCDSARVWFFILEFVMLHVIPVRNCKQRFVLLQCQMSPFWYLDKVTKENC